MGLGEIAWLLIGIVVGLLTGKIMKGSGFGLIVDMIVGILGALFGGFMFRGIDAIAVTRQELISSITIAAISGAILTFLYRVFINSRTV